MLHRGDALYRAGRNNDLLKLKPQYDAEAKVIGHQFRSEPKSGSELDLGLENEKPTPMLKSLLVELSNGLQFRIGTGFSKEQRRNPPAIQSIITFKYYGLTKRGIPRHASFVRIRRDQQL